MIDSVDAVMAQIVERVNNDEALVRRGRYVNLTFQFGVTRSSGDEQGEASQDYLITVQHGRIADVQRRTLSTETGVFSVRASLSDWRRFWQPVPPRDYQDLFSMLPKNFAKLDGDLLPLMQNLQYFKDVLACGRQQRSVTHA